MAVYVDAPVHRYRRMIMCHMLADTEQELHAMADKIGVKRKWYQSKASTPHYDICKAKRELALSLGAVEVDRKQLVQIIRRLRQPAFNAGDKVITDFTGKTTKHEIVSRRSAHNCQSGFLYCLNPPIGSGEGIDQGWLRGER